MHTTFYIDISIQTYEGPRRFGRFDIGQHRKPAYELFRRLKGCADINPKDMLFIEFMETINDLPVNLEVLSCNLHELGTNCMLITQEVFRLENLSR